MNRTQPKLDPVMKDKWIAALRSHEYSQGQEFLIQPNTEDDEDGLKFCCLGVLCDVLEKDNFPGLKIEESDEAVKGVHYSPPFRGSISPENWNFSHELLPVSLAVELFGVMNADNPVIRLDADDPLLHGWTTDSGRHPAVSVDDHTVGLAELNDSTDPFRVGFEEIARLIESYM